MADICGPVRAVIAFDPEFGIRQVAKQRPAARSVPASDLPTLGHGGQERVSVLFGYPIFDSDDDRAGAAPNGNGRIGFVEALKVEVHVFGLRSEENTAEHQSLMRNSYAVHS